MKIIKGDLIELAKAGEFDVIVQGCNCFNTMGSGLARTIKQEFPEAYAADCRTTKGDPSKLGNYSFATVNLENQVSLTILNAYTQFNYWDKGDLFNYEAFQKILDRIKGIDYSTRGCSAEDKGYRWGFPLIGCGLAGGDKERILGMIETTLDDVDVTIVEFDKNP